MKQIDPNTLKGRVLEIVRNNPGCLATVVDKGLGVQNHKADVRRALVELTMDGNLRREARPDLSGGPGRSPFAYWYITHDTHRQRGGARPKSGRPAFVEVVPPPVAQPDLLLVVPVGKETVTLTFAQARALYDTLGAVFK